MRSVSVATTLVLALGLACGGAPDATFNETLDDGAATTHASAAGKELPGTYLGVCQRMSDCGCAPATTPKACARMMEDAQQHSTAIAAQFGVKIDVMVDEGALFAAANASCDAVCSEGGAATGGSVQINAGGVNGASIKIAEDTDL